MSVWRGTFSHDGGALTNQGIHHIDLLRYLNGEIKSVRAIMRTLGSKIEVEDTVLATLTFQNGSVGNLEITTAARPDDFEASILLSISFAIKRFYFQFLWIKTRNLCTCFIWVFVSV